ncbi:MAG: hypothetical protein ACFFD9_09775, partial [Candidatus Thorarchaeota archaeon]
MEPEDIYSQLGHVQDRLADVTASSDVFTRQFGSELASWELNLLKAFKRWVSAGLDVYRGFVHHTRDKSLILLTPSPWLVEGIFVQFHRNQEVPPDGSQIEVVGRTAAVSRTLERSGKLVKALYADSYEVISLDVLSAINPPLSLKEISTLLFENVGMAEASKRVFALLFVSSPPIHQAVGGLTAGIQAMASKSQVQRLLTFIRRVLPPTLRGRWPKRRRVSGIRVSTPRLWRLDVGQQVTKKMEDLCV